MDRLKGTWKFTKVVELESSNMDAEWETKVEFESNGEEFNRLYYGFNRDLYGDPARPYPIGVMIYRYWDEETHRYTRTVNVMLNGKWAEDLPLEYRTIEILSNFYEVEDYDMLIEDLESNAIFTPIGTDYVQIPITSPTGVRLRTKNKFVGHDIGVVPVLSELTVEQDGEYEPDEHSVGFKKVTFTGRSLGKSEGAQEERTRFWTALQDNGNRTDWDYAFSGSGWTDEIYNPVSDFKVSTGQYMFRNSLITDTKRVLDLSEGSGVRIFSASNLVTAYLKVAESTNLGATFANANDLAHLRIEGVLGYSGTSFSACPLDKESLLSIKNALQDNSGSTSAKKIVFGSDNLAKFTKDELDEIAAKGWACS